MVGRYSLGNHATYSKPLKRSTEEQRRHDRFPMSARVKLTHPALGSLTMSSRDMSDGGIFLNMGDAPPIPLNSEVEVQALDVPFEAPVLRMRVVRIEASGIGLAFIDSA